MKAIAPTPIRLQPQDYVVLDVMNAFQIINNIHI